MPPSAGPVALEQFIVLARHSFHGGLSMIRPENNAKGRNLHAPDKEEHMRIYIFDQPFMSILSPNSASDFAITLSIVPVLNSLASANSNWVATEATGLPILVLQPGNGRMGY
jgi:hypothetical protein